MSAGLCKTSEQAVSATSQATLPTLPTEVILKSYQSSASQEVPRTLWNFKVHHRAHNNPPLFPVLSHINPVQALQFSFLKNHFTNRHAQVWRSLKHVDFLRRGHVSQPLSQPTSRRITQCRLSATVYWIQLRLPSTSAGRLLHPHLRTRHAVVTGTHLTCSLT